MSTVRVYKRAESKVKMSAQKAAEILAKQDVRVRRPALLDFMVGGGFAKLPVTSSGHINAPYVRPKDQGWEIPIEDRGRKAQEMLQQMTEAAQQIKNPAQRKKFVREQTAEIRSMTSDLSTRNSIRLWVEKNLEQFGIDPESVSVVIDND